MLWPPSETYPCWVRAALALILFGLSGYVAFFVALVSIDTFLVLKGVYLTLALVFLVSGAIKGYYGWWEFHEIEELIPRFLPYTMNNRRPTADALIRWYLKLPVAWPIFGKQFFVVAKKNAF